MRRYIYFTIDDPEKATIPQGIDVCWELLQNHWYGKAYVSTAILSPRDAAQLLRDFARVVYRIPLSQAPPQITGRQVKYMRQVTPTTTEDLDPDEQEEA